jgi:hypothetical protein
MVLKQLEMGVSRSLGIRLMQQKPVLHTELLQLGQFLVAAVCHRKVMVVFRVKLAMVLFRMKDHVASIR